MANNLSRRTFVRGALAAGALTAAGGVVAACSSSAGGGGGGGTGGQTLRIMNYGGVFQDAYQKAVIDPFLQSHPGVDVQVTGISGSSDMLANLRVDGDASTIDLVIMDKSVAASANAEGIFTKMPVSEVPNVANVLEFGRNTEGFGPAVTFDSIVLMYNTDNVSPAPRGWEYMWEPAATRLALISPPSILAYGWLINLATLMEVDYRQSIDPVLQRVAELRPKVDTFDPQPEQYTLTTSGNANIGLGYNARAQQFHRESNGALAIAETEASVFQINTINLTTNAPNPDLAREFANYSLEPETQQRFSEAIPYSPSVGGVKLNAETEKLLLRADSPKAIPFDWTFMTQEVRDSWSAAWRSGVVGG